MFSIWSENILGYFSVDIICSERRTILVNLQRFRDAPFTSIYRDFMMSCLRQFTEISWCPVWVNLQGFHDAPFASISEFELLKGLVSTALRFSRAWWLEGSSCSGKSTILLLACYFEKLCLPENDPVNHFFTGTFTWSIETVSCKFYLQGS